MIKRSSPSAAPPPALAGSAISCRGAGTSGAIAIPAGKRRRERLVKERRGGGGKANWFFNRKKMARQKKAGSEKCFYFEFSSSKQFLLDFRPSA